MREKNEYERRMEEKETQKKFYIEKIDECIAKMDVKLLQVVYHFVKGIM